MSAEITGDRLIRCEGTMEKYSVPEGIRIIDDLAFSGAEALTEISVPESVQHIGNYAFRMCYSLVKISLPERVSSIGAGVFQHCWKLRKVSLPEGTEMIGAEMFESCHSLESISIPESAVQIDRSAFSGCRSLREIIISPEQIKKLPPAARYTAALSYMERNAGKGGNAVIDEYAGARQGNFLDLAINRRSDGAVRYMLENGILSEEVLREYLGKSALRNRLEITALILEYGHNRSSGRDPIEEDPFL